MREAEIRAALQAEARTWLGTPFRKNGRAKGAGADCPFVEEVANAVFGLSMRHLDYSHMPKDGALAREIESSIHAATGGGVVWLRPGPGPAPREILRPGDVALFTMADRRQPQHVGLLAAHPGLPGEITLIHAAGGAGRGRVVEHRISGDPTWMRRLSATFTLVGEKTLGG